MRSGGRLAVATLVAAIFLAVAAPVRAAIHGVITDASTHQGIVSGVEICAFKALASQAEAEATPESKFCTTPEEDPEVAGEYNIGGLPEASYKVAFLPEPGSKYATQFYDHVATWEEALAIAVVTGGSNLGIDAALVEETTPTDPGANPAPSGPAPTGQAPAIVSPAPTSSRPRPLRCKKGFRRKKVKGKARCVKVHLPKRRPHG